MMYKIKMFALWLLEKSEGLRDTLLMLSFFGGAIFGILFLWVDLAHLEQFQYGWFYNLFRLPTYFTAAFWLGLIVSALGNKVIEWGRRQYIDYQAFVISGGKHKRKNEDIESTP